MRLLAASVVVISLFLATNSRVSGAPVPVAWWRMDEAESGLLTAAQLQDSGSGGNSSNTSGNDGAVPEWVTSGVPTNRPFADGRALRLGAGSTSILFGQGAGDELQITDEITILGRVLLQGGGSSLVAKEDLFTNGHRVLVTEETPGNFAFTWEVSDDGTQFDLSLQSPAVFSTTEWTEFATVFRPSIGGGANNGFAAIYKDGFELTSTSHDLEFIFNNFAVPFRIGGSVPFQIEQLQVFDTALSEQDILAFSAGDIDLVPEPSTLPLIFLGLVGMTIGERRNNK